MNYLGCRGSAKLQVLLAILVGAVSPLEAQDFPQRTVRIAVQVPPAACRTPLPAPPLRNCPRCGAMR